ncbi:MAG: ABC transporter substrate-binding protein [Actinomycetota bacterium]|nr:ABC transporter substrate-binding protein [Actinomycetota bacterium]
MGKVTVFVVTIAVTVTASACTGGPERANEGLPAGHGGTLTAVMTSWGGSPYEPEGFDPQVLGFSSGIEAARCCLFRTLMSYNGQTRGGEGGTPLPDLAAGVPTVSADGFTWTFRLKAGLHYAPPLQHTEIVAQDVIRGVERALAPMTGSDAKTICGGTPCLMGDYFANLIVGVIEGGREYANGDTTTISGLEAPDAHTLRVRLTQPSGDVAYLFALPHTSPIPAKPGDPTSAFGVAEGHNVDYGRGFAVASGPYMVEGSGALDPSLPADQQTAAVGAARDSFTMVRNPSWDPATDDLRVAYSDKIVIVGAKNLKAGEQMVEQGRADLVFDYVAPPSMARRYQSSPSLQDRLFIDPSDTTSVMTMDLAVPPLDDVHVRKAINLAIDKTALEPILARYLTFSSVATHIGLNSEESDLLQNYAPFGSGGGDVGAAQDEMAQSRYDRNGDGVCDASACSGLTLLVPDHDPARVAMASSIKTDLAPIGVDVAVTRANDSRWYAWLSDPAPEKTPLTLLAYYKNYHSASDWFTSIFSSGIVDSVDPTLLGASPEQLRQWGYPVRSVPNVDVRMQACAQQTSDAQVACWASFDQYLTATVVPWVPLLSWNGAFIVSSHVARFSIDQSTPFPAASLDRIELKPAAASPSA